MTSPIAAPASTQTTNSATAPRNINANDPANAQDRFLKLLVAQLNNQDPMNPLDNAQMTSQIAQINTVTGIQQLNQSVAGLAEHFAALQLMQGSAMVGRQVLVEGDTLVVDPETHKGNAAFELNAAAASVTVQVLDANGKEIGKVEMGALKAGRHNFDWDAAGIEKTEGLRFKVEATNGKTAVEATTLTRDKVLSVGAEYGTLLLQLNSGGSAPYSAVRAIL